MHISTHTIPKPYQAPRIEIGDASQKRWVTVPVHQVSLGDIVRGLGLLVEIQTSEDKAGFAVMVIRLIFQNGKTELYAFGDTVIAFTAADGVEIG